MDITKLLKEKNLTKAAFAERVGIASQNVNKTLANPTEQTIIKIAEALDVPVWRLFADPAEVGKQDDTAGNESGTILCPGCGKRIIITAKVEV